MINVSELKAAIGLLDSAKDDQWDADGNPNLEVVSKLVGQKVEFDDLQEAGSPKRPGWKPAELGAVDFNDPTTVARALAQARGRHDELKADKDKLEATREDIRVALVENGKLIDVQINLIARYSPVVDQAQGVKRIQEQTVRELQRRKEASATALQALAATGVHAYPSKIDAARAAMKRSPEQVANMAKYVHQNAAARNAAAA